MIVDDGTKSRGHRKNILSNQFQKIGIASGMHKAFKHFTVVVFHGDSKNSELDDSKYDIEMEWPEDAISLRKYINLQSDINERVIAINYIFTLKNGEEITKLKIITEKNKY